MQTEGEKRLRDGGYDEEDDGGKRGIISYYVRED